MICFVSLASLTSDWISLYERMAFENDESFLYYFYVQYEDVAKIEYEKETIINGCMEIFIVRI